MSRSSYIYVVTDDDASLPIATFTVKHEMVRWLKGSRSADDTRVYRYRDGTFGTRVMVEMDIGELLA